jgi:hypothetical protein
MEKQYLNMLLPIWLIQGINLKRMTNEDVDCLVPQVNKRIIDATAK